MADYARMLAEYGVNDTDQSRLERSNNALNVFSRRYYSGSDVFICFNNIPMTEIFELEYSMAQPVQAIYGYGSFTWDAVAYGSRYVEGRFRMNFQEAFQLRATLDLLASKGRGQTVLDNSSYAEVLGSDITLSHLYAQLRNSTDAEIKTLAEAYEARLWRNSDPVSKREQTAWADVNGGYDYLDGTAKFRNQYNPLLKYGFDIVVAFGDKLYEMDQQVSANSTAKVLNNVHLTSYRTIYEPNGRPISEEYGFIARDMDDSLDLSGTF